MHHWRAGFVALGLLALAGCAKKDGPPPVHIAGTINLLPGDPRATALMRMICAHTECRPGTSVHLRIPNGPDFVNEDPLHSPYYSRQLGMIFLEAGETLSFEMDEASWGPTEIRYVEKITHPERTLTVKLEQSSELAGGYGMRLTVSNPFNKALKFTVREAQPGKGPDVAAGLCPAPPHGESRKTWPYPVMQTTIENFTFVPTEEAEACAP